MLESGIVAVGDISNTTDSFAQKQQGNLYYYTFVEFFDLFQDDNAQATYDQYSAVYGTRVECRQPKHGRGAAV